MVLLDIPHPIASTDGLSLADWVWMVREALIVYFTHKDRFCTAKRAFFL
jgi:hypothetical protein